MATTQADPCAFTRRQAELQEALVADLQETLGDPFDDLPPGLEEKLERMLEQAKSRLDFLRKELAECEAQR